MINNLPQLQNLVKRDPISYREEFLQQWNHYDSIRSLYEAKPDDSDNASRFRELVTFISQVCQCYKEETREFPGQLIRLLMEQYGTLTPELRKSLVQNLVLLRNKDVITSIEYAIYIFYLDCVDILPRQAVEGPLPIATPNELVRASVFDPHHHPERNQERQRSNKKS